MAVASDPEASNSTASYIDAAVTFSLRQSGCERFQLKPEQRKALSCLGKKRHNRGSSDWIWEVTDIFAAAFCNCVPPAIQRGKLRPTALYDPRDRTTELPS